MNETKKYIPSTLLTNDWFVKRGYLLFLPLDGPAIVRVNLFVRSIATISDIKMVSIENAKQAKLRLTTVKKTLKSQFKKKVE